MRLPLLALPLLALLGSAPLAAQEPAPGQDPVARAFAELLANPRDAYLQFAVLQLASRTGELGKYRAHVEHLARREQSPDVYLFDLFTGALAVQESLQLDRLTRIPPVPGPAIVPIDKLAGPQVVSHPWQQLLAGRRPDVSPMAMLVPADFWLAEFPSVQKLLQLADRGDVYGSHLLQQAAREAIALDFGERLRRQLAIETTPLLRPFYDQVVESIALTGSDAYLREGTDLTLLFRLRQPELFRARMQSFLDAAKQLPEAATAWFEIAGVRVEQVATSDGAVRVFAADPAPDLHVRSNSRAALERVLATVAGTAPRLGDSDEMRYVRTLLPAGAPEEDGFVYLSDAFVRRIVGPQVKLQERRRLLCSSMLRMIGHAGLLHRTEHGEPAASLALLQAARCLPEGFGEGALGCPEGGTLSLAADGLTGCCSRHGRLDALRPCLELGLAQVTALEATVYAGFVKDYEQYWRSYFDPIAVRIAVAPGRQRIETLVLPLIDNTIYTQLAQQLGGAPVELGDGPRTAGTLFQLAGKPAKKALQQAVAELLPAEAGKPGGALPPAELQALFERGLGDEIALHVADAAPMFDFSLPRFFGEIYGWFGRSAGFEEAMVGFLVAALNAPVYATVEVRDAAVVDAFLERLDGLLALRARQQREDWWWEFELDFSHLAVGVPVRCARVGFSALGWRLYWARVRDHVVIATKKEIVDELARGDAVPAPAASPAPAATGHALLQLRPEAWRAVRPDYELGWAENARRACLDNQGPVQNLLRVLPAEVRGDRKALAGRLEALARTVYGGRFYCPDGGEYLPDGDGLRCSVHGTPQQPRQTQAPAKDSEVGRMLAGFRGLRATLTFLPEGLRAVVEVEQR
ncbi:MAG: hypothetical protein FJ265_02645 [Planctomycetes bacterium]|nr:hypothetical protein [Planctomycetota bacterium]